MHPYRQAVRITRMSRRAVVGLSGYTVETPMHGPREAGAWREFRGIVTIGLFTTVEIMHGSNDRKGRKTALLLGVVQPNEVGSW